MVSINGMVQNILDIDRALLASAVKGFCNKTYPRKLHYILLINAEQY